MLEREQELSLYIHVPFCTSRCIYCDFYSTVSDDIAEESAKFVDALIAQIQNISKHFSGIIVSVYFGGGTPSLLGDAIALVLNEISQDMTLSSNAEITIEANPDSLTASALHSWRKAGATRISLGVQSFCDETLNLLGRIHSKGDVHSAIALLRDENWSFSLDLIAGVPGVSEKEWSESLMQAASSGAAHLSVYPLSVEESTPLEVLISRGVIDDVDEDASADQMLAARHRLMHEGYEHYEISNFAKPGFESKHNSRYWTGGAYLGLGPGAASMLYSTAPETGRTRFALHDTLEEYLSDPETLMPGEWEDLSREEAASEDIMLGMRLFQGVSTSVIEQSGLAGVMNHLLEQGLVELAHERYRLTERGWLLGNQVFSAIWCDK